MALVRWLEESPIRPEEAGAVRCTRCGTQLDFTNVRICCVCAELYCYMHCVSGLCDRCYSLPDSEAEVADAQTRMVPATHEAAVAVAKRPRSRSRAGRSKAIRIRSPAPVAARAANANSLPRGGKFWVGWIREAIVGGLRDQRSAAVAAQGPRSFFVRTLDLEQRLGSRQVRRDSRDRVAFRI